jgi:hypothetical protein
MTGGRALRSNKGISLLGLEVLKLLLIGGARVGVRREFYTTIFLSKIQLIKDHLLEVLLLKALFNKLNRETKFRATKRHQTKDKVSLKVLEQLQHTTVDLEVQVGKGRLRQQARMSSSNSLNIYINRELKGSGTLHLAILNSLRHLLLPLGKGLVERGLLKLQTKK